MATQHDESEWVSVTEAAKRCNISRTPIIRAIERGDLPSRKEGKLRMVQLASVEDMSDEISDDPEQAGSVDIAIRLAKQALQSNADTVKSVSAFNVQLAEAWESLGINPAIELLRIQEAALKAAHEENAKLREERRAALELLEAARTHQQEREIEAATFVKGEERKDQLVELLKAQIPKLITARAVDSKLGRFLSTLAPDQIEALRLVLDPEQVAAISEVAADQRVRFNVQTLTVEPSHEEGTNTNE